MRRVRLIAIWLCVIVLTCGCLSAQAELADDAADKRCLIIGMNTGLPSESAKNYHSLKQNWTAAMRIMVPYLMQHGQLDKIVIDHISQNFQKKAAIVKPVTSEGDLLDALIELVEQPYKSIDKLNSYPLHFLNFVSVLDEQVRATDGNVDVWLVEGRYPMYVEQEASVANKSQRKSAEMLSALLLDYPALRIHFLYVHAEEDPLGEVETAEGVRLDEVLRRSDAGAADRVCTWDICAESINGVDGAAAITQICAAQFGNAYQVGDSLTLQMQEGEENRYAAAYTHTPWMDDGPVLLCIQGDKRIEALTLLDDNGIAVDSVAATLMQESAVVFVPALSGGNYTLQVQAAAGAAISAIPVTEVPVEARQVTLTLTNDGSAWLRDDQEFFVSTNATDVSAEMWTPALRADGTQIDVAFDAPVENEDGYTWRGVVPGSVLQAGTLHLQATLDMVYPNCVQMCSETVPVEIVNRPAEASQAGVDQIIRVLTGIPNKSSIEKMVTLADLFVDADGDTLTFELIECSEVNGEETNVLYTWQTEADSAMVLPEPEMTEDGAEDPAPESEMIMPLQVSSGCMSATFTGDMICYQPFTGDQISYNFIVRARDDYGIWSDTVTITFMHIDLPAYLQTLRAEHAEQVDAEGKFHVRVQNGHSIWLMINDTDALPILQQAMEEYQLPEIAIPVTYTLQDQSQTGVFRPVLQGEEERLGMELTLPVATRSDQYTISFGSDAAYADMALPELMTEIGLSGVAAENMPPVLQSETWPETAAGELKDFFNKKGVTILLSELLGVESPLRLRYDDENIAGLQYCLIVADENATVIDADGCGLQMLRQGEYLLQPNEQGEAVFDIRFAARGHYDFAVYASDGELSSTPMEIGVRIESENVRLLTLIAIIAAAVIAVTVIVIIVIVALKPRFRDLYLGICVCEEKSELHKPEARLPLGFFGKKSTTMLTAALSLQQPLVKGMDAAVLAGITMSPSRKQGVYAVLTFDKNAQQLGIVGAHGITGVPKTLEVASDDIALVSKSGSCIRMVFSHQTNLL